MEDETLQPKNLPSQGQVHQRALLLWLPRTKMLERLARTMGKDYTLEDKILEEEKLASKLTENGLKTAKQFTWEKTTDQVEKLFLEKLNERNAL